MYVYQMINQLPDQFDNACIFLIQKGSRAKQIVEQTAQAGVDAATQTAVWQDSIKPMYERNIAPLNRHDFLFLGGTAAAAFLIAALAIKRFSIGILPLAAGAATLMMMGACLITRQKIHRHFNNVAWDHLNEIEQLVQATTPDTQRFGDIAAERNRLNAQEFNRFENYFSQLDQEMIRFRDAIVTPQGKDLEDAKKTLLQVMEGVKKQVAPHK